VKEKQKKRMNKIIIKMEKIV